MIVIYGLSLLILSGYVFYRYYYKPKSEIGRYKAIFKKLGYTFYEIPFAFLGLSFMGEMEKGRSLHKDALYFERTVYPHVDLTIGNVLDQVLINFVKPQLIKDFLSIDTINKYPKNKAMFEGIMITLGVGLIFSEGQLWKNKRKLLSKVFNFDLIKENISKISSICLKCYDHFDKIHQIGQNKVKYSSVDISSKMFNSIIMKCFFGSDLAEEQINGKKFEEFIVQTSSLSLQLAWSPIMGLLGNYAWKLGLTSQIRELKENIRLLRERSKEILKRRTEEVLSSPKSEKPSDIIQALVYEKIENKQDFSYSDEDLIAEFQNFLVVGTDTTTHFYTMLVYYLGKHPQIQERLRREIDSIIKSEEDITYENLKKLTYLEWIQLQTTRHFGPTNGIFFRMAAEDNFIMDIPIKKGTIANYQVRGNHYSSKYYKNPEEFRPERWESECDGIDPYAFMGFSAGPRSCIGKQLAYIESKIAVIHLIKRYQDIEVPQEITMKFGFVYEAEPFDMIFTTRKK